MAEESEGPPPIPGNWATGIVTRTGEWTIGNVWIDRETHRYALRVEPRHCNGVGMMHGGAMATLLDGQAFVFQDPEARDAHTPTISLSVDFLAPPQIGDWVVAEVQLVKVTRSLIVTQALAKVGDRVVARSNMIYSNSKGKDAS
jgi:uncharacterized protein (TIGR00369 family)